MTEVILFICKGVLLTEVLTRAIRTWGIFEDLRQLFTMIDFFKRLLACFECTSIWVASFVTLYLLYFEWPILSYLLIFSALARYLHTGYELLDAARAVKEGEI